MEHDCADGQIAHEVVDEAPGRSGVGGFPDAARASAGQEHRRLGWMDGERAHAAADVGRPNPVPLAARNTGSGRTAFALKLLLTNQIVLPLRFRLLAST